MQAIAYEGYFKDGRFYASGQALQIPERRRVIITILDEVQGMDSDKQMAWDDFKHMAKGTSCENDLLTSDVFNRSNSGRELIDFTDGADTL